MRKGHTNSLAGGLQLMGVVRGDRIALYVGNRPEMALLALAINKLGAVWIPINRDCKGEWLLDTLNRGRCKLLVTDAALQNRMAENQPRLQREQLVLIDKNDSHEFTGVVANLCWVSPTANSGFLISGHYPARRMA